MNRKTLHIDLGNLSYHPDDHMIGVHRVTLSLAKAMSHLARYNNTDISLVSLLHDGYYVPDNIMRRYDLAKVNKDLALSHGMIFLLDSYYYKFKFLNKALMGIKNNFTIIDYIHDLIPIVLPDIIPGSEHRFRSLLKQSFLFSHAIMTPSKTTVINIIDYISSNEDISVGKSLKLGYNYHGSDITPRSITNTTNRIQSLLEKSYFLMVGTVEIHKNHLHVLNAFEKLWSQGIDVTLCIAGKIGWKVSSLLEQLKGHPQQGERLIFINNPSDGELAQLYKNADCLIFASEVEGFGLPIVEAAYFNTPLLLSDIPIFREIAGSHARYFSLGDINSLSQAVIKFIEDSKTGKMNEDSRQINPITWLQSAKHMLNDITHDHWYFTIHADKSVEYHS